jgi:hypothetical protein
MTEYQARLADWDDVDHDTFKYVQKYSSIYLPSYVDRFYVPSPVCLRTPTTDDGHDV